MFNFHKPRTYRSTEGCCICKAKSSSSRFTDSRKYERDTMQCFDLKYPRQGEICNACVLLVKRFKRLPVGSKRNWSHIVDAKAGIGPGYNKIQTKYKSERINSRAAAAAALQQQISATSSSSTSNNGAVNGNALNGLNSYIPEKFSKIFKKTKKLKDSSCASVKRKTTHNNWSQSNNTQSLPTTPHDSLDSDYEDSRHQLNLAGVTAATASSTGGAGGGTIVQFQTQTRASAYKAQAAAEARKRIIKLGTKRRKCLPPRKFRRSMGHEESLEFFDEEEWQERKSCCGMLYECAALGGALIIQADSYKPCEQHQRTSRLLNPAAVANTTAANNDKHSPVALIQKSIIQTVPAVVQLQPPTTASAPSVSVSYSSSSSSSSSNLNNNLKTATTTTPTPVLKKHHLFFKRQSECFPQGDMVTANNSNTDSNHHNTPAHVVNIIKTESEFNVPQQQQQNSTTNNNTTTLQRHIENAIHSSTSPNTIITSSSSALSISVTTSSSSSSTTMPQMPKHSLAKVTTISPPLTTTTTNTTLHPQHQQHYLTAVNNNGSNSNLAKPNTFLHKIKADSSSSGGKVVKHSLEKFNTAVRLKTSDIHEMKPIIRTVDKSYILAKPPTQANIITLNATNATSQATYQSLASYNATAQPPLTTASLSAASPTSSTSSTSSTKFSDNSSDSGFDENMLDRKSASPLQEDCEKKILSRPGVQTMFLASGVQIQGQPQNLVLTGNEVAAKILQNRKYSSITTNPISTNSRSHHPTTTAVKIAQISTTSLTTSSSGGPPPTSTMSSAAQAKMRAIYNNTNTIQHENGITTIVPASSLAATTQTAAMQNIAPSTVTITPAPPVGTQFNTQNVISRKLTAANIINLQSNTSSNSPHNNNNNQHHHQQQQQQHHQHHHHPQQQHHHLNNSNNNHHHHNNSTTNQKIILLKTSPNNTTTVTATAANYNTLSGGGGGHHGNSGGGGR